MAEAVAAVSLVASIAQLIDFGSKVVSRLIEYQKVAKDSPKVFKVLHTKLPLIVDALKRISAHAERDGVAELVLVPAITGCQQEIESINRLLAKTLPRANDSRMTRAKKAAQSIRQEKEIERIAKSLSDYLAVLVLHSAAYSVNGKLQPDASSNVFMVPFERDNTYIERTEVIQQLDTVLQDQRRVVLAGAGGVGKSQIAIEHCYRFQEQHDNSHVFWIHASTIERALGDWNQMARHLRIPGLNEPEADILQLTREHLCGTTQMSWLLVLDNVDDADVLFYTPTASAAQNTSRRINLLSALPISKAGTIMVTTRDRRIGEKLVGTKATVNVPTFGLGDAKILLRSRLTDLFWDEVNATELVTELDCLPLAVNQAAAFISENNMPISDYLISLQGEGDEIRTLLDQEIYDVRRDQEMQAPVLRTWRLSFDLIGRQKPRAIEVLGLMAVLDRQGIPKCLLERSGESPVELYLALGVLQAFSIISVEIGGTTFGMHRLSQVATQAWLDQRGTLQQYRYGALSALRNKFPDQNPEHWKHCEALVPHAQVIFRYQYISNTEQLELAALLHDVAMYHENRGRFEEARERLSEALDIKERIHGTGHLELVEYYTSLADCLTKQGKHCTAEKLLRSAYETTLEAFGSGHSQTFMSLLSLSYSFWSQRRYREAKALLQQGLDVASKTIGETNPITHLMISGLAYVHDYLGESDSAERLHRQALSIRSRTLKDEDDQEQMGKSEFANFLERHGRHPQAETLLREIWATRSEAYGPHDRLTIESLTELLGCLRHQGKYEEAESLARRALQLRRESLGPEHPDTSECMTQLASVIQPLGKYDEAEQLYVDAMEIRSRICGIEHPDTVSAMIAYTGFLLSVRKRYDACEDLCRRILDIQIRTEGPNHPRTLLSMDVLAATLRVQDKIEEALEIQREVLAAREEGQGPDHPHTLQSMDHVIGSAWGQGHLEEATKVLRRALMLREHRFGEKDPETLIRMTRLAYLLKIQGMTDESLGLYQRAKQTLGEESETTKDCATCVADMLAEKMASTTI